MAIRCARAKFGVGLIAAAVVLMAVLADAGPALGQGMTLQGVWVVTTQQRNCETGVAMGAPHRALVSFHAGGTLSDSSAVPSFAIGQRSEGHGTWSHSGGHTYTANWIAMIVFETAPNLPVTPGFVPGWQVASNTITLTGPDSFTSNGVSNFVNLAGSVYRTGCASREGDRFK